jgi:hypothetical protein
MIIAHIEGATRICGKAQGYLGLPLRDELINDTVNGEATPAMVTAWTPTPEELAALNAGAAVHVRILGSTPPPMMVLVGPAPEQMPAAPDPRLSAGNGVAEDVLVTIMHALMSENEARRDEALDAAYVEIERLRAVPQTVWMTLDTAPRGTTICVARKGGQRDDGSTYWYQAVGHYDLMFNHFHKMYGELYGEPEVWARYPENPERCPPLSRPNRSTGSEP